MGIAFLNVRVQEIRQYLAVHQIYLGRSASRGHRNLWSFTAIEDGRMFEIDGPIVIFEDRKTASGKTARRMVVNQPHFQVSGIRRWYRAEDMARFAFQRGHGFRWRDLLDAAPADPLTHLALGHAWDDRMRSRPYGRPGCVPGLEDAHERLLSLCEGYGMAQCGHGFGARVTRTRRAKGQG